MDMVVKSEKQNALLGRKEVVAEVTYDAATPSTADVTKMLAQHFNSSEELVKVQHIYAGFGQTKAEVTAWLYNDKAALAKLAFTKKPKKKKKAEAVAEGGKK